MDNRGVNKYDLNKYCAVLAKEFDFASRLNSTARQSSAERAWSAISRFFDAARTRSSSSSYDTCSWGKSPPSTVHADKSFVSTETKGLPACTSATDCLARPQCRASTTAQLRCVRKKQIPGKKGYPKFKKHSRSVEYKKSGWKLDCETKKHLIFTDKNNIGRVKLIGSRDIYYYQPEQIKRVRLVRRADGYYVQFSISIEIKEQMQPTGKAIGLDMGLRYFYADSFGNTETNPRFYRQGERKLNRLNRQKSVKYQRNKKPQSNNYHKARKRYALAHLKVSRQRKDHAVKLARCVCASNDCIVYEDLKVRNLVRNSKLAKSITDAGWTQFRSWVEYYGWKMGKITIAVPPHFTSQDCPNCNRRAKKSLSTRTHVCECGCTLDRDHAASIQILRKGLNTVGHTGMYAWGDLPSWSVGSSNLLANDESLNQESPSSTTVRE